jgi:hypothetical protein
MVRKSGFVTRRLATYVRHAETGFFEEPNAVINASCKSIRIEPTWLTLVDIKQFKPYSFIHLGRTFVILPI